ncbi:MAG: TolC family protein, partial [Candidatus Binatia bacterium]
MKLPIFFLVVLSLLWAAPHGGSADDGTPLGSLDLSTAIEQALQNNPDLKAKRQALGIVQGRVQQADLLLQNNPELSVDVAYRNRRFIAPTGRSVADVEVGLLQEFEIAGQRGDRREAAAKNLAQAEWSVIDAERLLRLEVTQVFYTLLALHEKIAVQREVLATQEILLELGQERFERKDLSVLDLDTLRSDRDRVQSDLVDRESERLLVKKQLHLLLGLTEEMS